MEPEDPFADLEGEEGEEMTDNELMYTALEEGNTLDGAVKLVLDTKDLPRTERTVYPVLKEFRSWLVSTKPPSWPTYEFATDEALKRGKANSDSRVLAAAQTAAILNKIGVPDDLVKRIVSTAGIPKREVSLALAAAERKGRGRAPMYA